MEKKEKDLADQTHTVIYRCLISESDLGHFKLHLGHLQQRKKRGGCACVCGVGSVGARVVIFHL